MKIIFVLLGLSKHPVGGFKIVFEYANRFTACGHDVCIVFDCLAGSLRHRKIPSFFAMFATNSLFGIILNGLL